MGMYYGHLRLMAVSRLILAKVQHALPQITPKKLLTIVGVLKAPLQVKLPIKLSVMLHFNQKYYL